MSGSKQIIWTDTLDQRLIEYAKKYRHDCSRIREAMGFSPDQDEQIKDRYNIYLKNHKPTQEKELFQPERDSNYLSMLVSHANHETIHWKEKAQIASELFTRSLDELESHVTSEHFNEFCHDKLCDVKSNDDIDRMVNDNINKK